MNGPKVRQLYPVGKKRSLGLKEALCLLETLSGQDRPQSRLERILEVLLHLMGLERGGIYLRDLDRRILTPLVTIGLNSDTLDDSPDNVLGYVLLNGEPLFRKRIDSEDEAFASPIFREVASCALLPWSEEPRGVLILLSSQPRDWSSEDKDFCLLGLRLIIQLIREIGLVKEIRDQGRLVRLVKRLNQVFHPAHDLTETLNSLVEGLQETLELSGVAAKLDLRGKIIQARSGILPEYCEDTCLRTAETKILLCEEALVFRGEIRPYQTVVCLPFEIPRGQGGLCLFSSEGNDGLCRALYILRPLLSILSRGLSTLVALEELRQQAQKNQVVAEQLTGLYEIGLHLLVPSSPHDIAQEFLFQLTTHPGLSCPKAALVLKRDHRRYLAEVREEGKVIFSGSVSLPREGLPPEIANLMGPDPLIYPLMAGPESLGVLVLEGVSSYQDDRGFRLLASYLAVSLEKALLYSGLERANRELLITKDRLVDSEKRAALGELAAAIAHEIRNPLSILGGLARRATRAKSYEEVQKYLQRLVSQVARLEKVLRGLLDVNYRCPQCFGQEDLNRLVEEALFLLEKEIGARGLRVEKDFQSLPLVDCDGQEIRYVLSCLILNAIQAMGEGGVLSIKTYSVTEPDPGVVCEVSDTGGGIPLEILPNIFNPFFGTKRSRGLGLALAYRIVRFHEGEILVDNRPGKGATFIVRLPLRGKSRRIFRKE